jgi:hypothetical protein
MLSYRHSKADQKLNQDGVERDLADNRDFSIEGQ